MRYRLAAWVLILAALPAFGDESQWEFRLAPRFWGATVAGRYMTAPPAVEGVETSITGLFSGAYESAGYYRTADGSFFSVASHGGTARDASYARVDLFWQAGIQQGIIPRTDVTNDLLVGFLLYQGQYQKPLPAEGRLFFESGRPETDGSLRGSLIGGLSYSDVTTEDVTRLRRGITAELALERAPPFIHNTGPGGADYSRVTLIGRTYLPVYRLEPRDGRNRLSSYLAAMAAFDRASGAMIPLAVRQTTGGRSPRTAPGGSVRGYGSGRFDATTKVIANVEVRTHLPSFVVPGIIPGVIVYTDAGWFDDAEGISASASEHEGILVSSGAGLVLDLFGSAQLVFYTNYLWTYGDLEGENWVPFSLGFGFHY